MYLPWTERYRPQTIADCVLPGLAAHQLKSFISTGALPHLLLSGSSGIGKTTVAMAACKELNAPYLFINGSDESGIDTLRTKVKDFCQAMDLEGRRKYVILDEADYLNQNSFQPALRGVMEEYAENAGFILTCNFPHRIIPALHSRSTMISFDPNDATERKQMMGRMLKRCRHILTEEGIAYDEKIVVTLIKKLWPDLRKVVNALEKYSDHETKTLSPAAVADGDTNLKIEELITTIKERNYPKARKWIGEYPDVDPAVFYRTVFEWAHTTMTEDALPTVILLCNDYQTKHVMALDHQVHLAAFCLEVMTHGKYN